MKRSTFFAALLLPLNILADDGYPRERNNGPIYIEPTLPGTSIKDYSRPGLVIQGDHAYQTIPGTNLKDFTRPGFEREGSMIYQTLPGTTLRDFSEPGYKIQEGEGCCD